MKAPEIIYFTNLENTTFNRSHNWEASRKLFYKVGYTYYDDWKDYPKNTIVFNNKGWHYSSESHTINNFLDTAAHEIGHTILKAYGGTFYSYGHKGTVNTVTQSENGNATNYPTLGEIDLMPYYMDWLDYTQRKRMVASEIDALSSVWLSKIEIKK